MKELTYLIYILFMATLLFGGTGYVVFFLGYSGWWFVLTIFIATHCYSPLKWIHGKED